jgi:release factor glutamine methyltransferase
MTEGVANHLTIGDLLKNATRTLSSLPSARLDAELLLAHAAQCDRVALIRERDQRVEASVIVTFETLVAMRAKDYPLAYLRGQTEFWSMSLRITEDVLVPRSETELLVAAAIEQLPGSKPLLLADLGTGSGAIALALASELKNATLIAIDRSAAALRVAADNARRCGVANVCFVQSDWTAALAANVFDAILANPPYVAACDPLLVESGLRYEPLAALAAGPEGLDDLAELATQAPRALAAGGWLMMEHGANQGSAVREMLNAAGLTAIVTLPDLAGLDRITLGQKRKASDG